MQTQAILPTVGHSDSSRPNDDQAVALFAIGRGVDRMQQQLAEFGEQMACLSSRVAGVESRLADRCKENFTTEDVAGLARRSTDTVRRWIRTGKLPATRVTGTGPKGRLIISRAALQQLLSEGLGGDLPDLVVGEAPESREN